VKLRSNQSDGVGLLPAAVDCRPIVMNRPCLVNGAIRHGSPLVTHTRLSEPAQESFWAKRNLIRRQVFEAAGVTGNPVRWARAVLGLHEGGRAEWDSRLSSRARQAALGTW
jgi:hypothetical protein